MPPHCDSLDGPVVTAAARALEASDVTMVLPYAPAAAEQEIARAFEQVRAARTASPAAREVADRFFFETVVRLHRAGEGAPYTGLKPAGLDVGPVIPAAEQAIERESANALIDLLCHMVRDEIDARFHEVMRLKRLAGDGVDASRRYVSAMLGLEVYSHTLFKTLKAAPHEHHG